MPFSTTIWAGLWQMQEFPHKKPGTPIGVPFPYLAAIAAAAAIYPVVAAAIAVAAATAAEQKNEDDDPPAAVTIVTTHKKYLQEFFGGLCRSFHGIPQRKKGAAK